MKSKSKIHYRVQGKCSANYEWSYWVVACGKKVENITTLTSVKENVTCNLCRKTAEFY